VYVCVRACVREGHCGNNVADRNHPQVIVREDVVCQMHGLSHLGNVLEHHGVSDARLLACVCHPRASCVGWGGGGREMRQPADESRAQSGRQRNSEREDSNSRKRKQKHPGSGFQTQQQDRSPLHRLHPRALAGAQAQQPCPRSPRTCACGPRSRFVRPRLCARGECVLRELRGFVSGPLTDRTCRPARISSAPRTSPRS
jgi:hypothetical protein